MGVKKYDKIVASKGCLVQTFEEEGNLVSICSLSKSNIHSRVTVEKSEVSFDLPLNAYFIIKGGCIALTTEEKLVSKVYHNTNFKIQLMSHHNFETIKRMYTRKYALKTGGV